MNEQDTIMSRSVVVAIIDAAITFARRQLAKVESEANGKWEDEK
jgi:hypothetical protein